MMVRIFPLIVAALLVGCAGQRTPPAPPAPLVRLHADMLVLREEARLRGVDSATLRRQTDTLLLTYNVSREWYEGELASLRTDLAGWKGFNERVAQRLDTLRRASEPPDTGKPKPATGPQ